VIPLVINYEGCLGIPLVDFQAFKDKVHGNLAWKIRPN